MPKFAKRSLISLINQGDFFHAMEISAVSRPPPGPGNPKKSKKIFPFGPFPRPGR